MFPNKCSNVQCDHKATFYTQLKRNELRKACEIHVASIIDLYQGKIISKYIFNKLLGDKVSLKDIIYNLIFLWIKL